MIVDKSLNIKKMCLIVSAFVLCNSNVMSQSGVWIDLNSNGFMDLYENPSADIDNRVYDLLSRLTIAEKIDLLHETSPAIPRLGISKFYHGNEALHGVVRPGKFTVFPQAIGLAATWSPELILKVATSISDEARGRWNELSQGKLQTAYFSDLLALWSPTVNMARDPRWGRTPETYGEDPFLTAKIGVAFVKGLQGDDSKYLKVVSTPKHFAANNEEHNRFECNAIISKRDLRSYYLPAFKALITEGKAASIMSAYNAINGVPCTANQWLLTDILRKEWGFNGYVVSDCGAPGFLVSHHKYVDSPVKAAAVSLKAGMDLECSGYCKECFIFRDYLKKAYLSGLVTEDEINTSTSRVLRMRFQLGLFDPSELNPYTKISPTVIASKEHQLLALETARQSIVLLKNKNQFLPLDPTKIKRIAVIGINANSAEFGDYSGLPANEAVTPYQGICNRALGKAEVKTIQWMGNLSAFQLIPDNLFSHKENIVLKPGVKVEYYHNQDLKGKPVVRVESKILFDPANQPPDPIIPQAPLSIRYSGYITPPKSGNYTFAVKNGYGVRLFVNDSVIINRWWDFTTNDTVSVYLESNKPVSFMLEYNSKEPRPYISLLWKTPVMETAELYRAEKDLAAKSDVVVAVVGINKSIEREGLDRTTLDLPDDQTDFLKQIYKLNKRLVVVLVAGSPLSINWIDEHIPAVVNAWYPGEQGGNAIADVLFGNYNPSGKLPLTYYKTVEELPPFNDYDITKGRTYQYLDKKPLYPFGHGLSYTNFKYSELTSNTDTLSIGDSLNISLNLQNTGQKSGAEVIQIYIVPPRKFDFLPKMQLKSFKKISLSRNENKMVDFSLRDNDFFFWISDDNYQLVEGNYTILVGSSSGDIRCRKNVFVTR